MPRIHLRVEGRVQGVGFRWFLRERARALGVAGWVRNLPDGCLELQAEGSEEGLSVLSSVVRRGPPGAHVTAVITMQAELVEPLQVPFIARR